MFTPSLRAQVAELCGEDLLDPEAAPEGVGRYPARRLPIVQALPLCGPGSVMPALLGDEEVVLCVLDDGSAVTLPDRCPHDGGLLSDGFMDGDNLVCARHGWEFDARSGQCRHREGLCIPSAGIAEGSGPVDS